MTETDTALPVLRIAYSKSARIDEAKLYTAEIAKTDKPFTLKNGTNCKVTGNLTATVYSNGSATIYSSADKATAVTIQPHRDAATGKIHYTRNLSFSPKNFGAMVTDEPDSPELAAKKQKSDNLDPNAVALEHGDKALMRHHANLRAAGVTCEQPAVITMDDVHALTGVRVTKNKALAQALK